MIRQIRRKIEENHISRSFKTRRFFGFDLEWKLLIFDYKFYYKFISSGKITVSLADGQI